MTVMEIGIWWLGIGAIAIAGIAWLGFLSDLAEDEKEPGADAWRGDRLRPVARYSLRKNANSAPQWAPTKDITDLREPK